MDSFCVFCSLSHAFVIQLVYIMDIKDHIAGFGIVFGVAALSYFLHIFHPIVDSMAAALIIGMIAGTFSKSGHNIQRGGEAALKFFCLLELHFTVFR